MSAWQVLLAQIVVTAAAALGVACVLARQAFAALDEARRVRADAGALAAETELVPREVEQVIW